MTLLLLLLGCEPSGIDMGSISLDWRAEDLGACDVTGNVYWDMIGEPVMLQVQRVTPDDRVYWVADFYSDTTGRVTIPCMEGDVVMVTYGVVPEP